jgi:S-formylglutathione hydrolase FrmB
MALLTVDFFSEALELGTSMTVVLPQPTQAQVGIASAGASTQGPPALYLLHGMSDDHTAWLRYTAIERYAAQRGLAVVMPAVARSFYANEAHGHAYWDFLSEELPAVVGRFFRVSDRREDTFVAGLSMGGYGAFKWALRQPERFAAAASMSGALDVVALATLPERDELPGRIYGGVPGSGEDLFALLADADPDALPSLYVGCGTEDHLFAGNTRFVDAAYEKGLDVEVDFRPGEHEWGFWDTEIQKVLAWLPLDAPD